MKRRYLALVILGTLLIIGGVIGLVWNKDVPTLTTEQVISRVQVYGVPAIPSYYGSAPNPVGQWSAVYEGENTWRVRGAVVTRYEGEDYYYSSTWIDNNTEIRLVSIIGKPPTPNLPTPKLPTIGGVEFGE